MEADVFFSSLVIALLLLLPLAMKWEISARHALAGALAVGGLTGVLLSWDLLRRNLGFLPVPLAESAFIVLMTTFAVLFFFYRDPGRETPRQKDIIVAPADGTVLYVEKVNRGKVPFSKKKGRRVELKEITKTTLLADGLFLVGISMNLLNVHVNRAPIDGRIIELKRHKGAFASLKKFNALLENERLTTIIDNGRFKVGVVQIASRLVRQIVSFLEEGDDVKIGQRIGKIRFGSQVDLVIPELPSLRIKAKPGDQVFAGESVIAHFSEQSQEDHSTNAETSSGGRIVFKRSLPSCK